MTGDPQPDVDGAEREFLARGLGEWGGPARCTDAMAVAIGFTDTADLLRNVRRLARAVENGDALAPREWRRIQLAVEVVFVSDVVGSGVDWPTTTGWSDAESITILRGIQRKILNATASLVDRPAEPRRPHR